MLKCKIGYHDGSEEEDDMPDIVRMKVDE